MCAALRNHGTLYLAPAGQTRLFFAPINPELLLEPPLLAPGIAIIRKRSSPRRNGLAQNLAQSAQQPFKTRAFELVSREHWPEPGPKGGFVRIDISHPWK
jgi:hypothetical protein